MLYTIKRGASVQAGVPEVKLEIEGGLIFGAPNTTGHQVELEPDRAASLAADGWLVEAVKTAKKKSEPESPAEPPAKRRGGSDR
jgi:hypothetical protein